jgi:hypothetical protein
VDAPKVRVGAAVAGITVNPPAVRDAIRTFVLPGPARADHGALPEEAADR